jgi:DNA-binding FrmR family transcriptional regulator
LFAGHVLVLNITIGVLPGNRTGDQPGNGCRNEHSFLSLVHIGFSSFVIPRAKCESSIQIQHFTPFSKQILRFEKYPHRVYFQALMNARVQRQVNGRLNRIAGQIAGIQRMAREGRYCVDILTQIAAVRSALDALGVELLTSHLESCVLGHGHRTEHKRAKPMTQKQLLAEVQTTLARFLK